MFTLTEGIKEIFSKANIDFAWKSENHHQSSVGESLFATVGGTSIITSVKNFTLFRF